MSVPAQMAPGIRRLVIPTPFLVGPVNLYLLDGSPLTLIDTGPNAGTSLYELEIALRACGHEVEDIELIVLTHQHVDHSGLLGVLVSRSGAEVAALSLLAGYLSDYPASAAADDEFALSIMRRHGVPDDMATVLSAVSTAYRSYGSGAEVTRPLRDGEVLEAGGRRWSVQHRPGHSPSDTLFLDEESGLMIGGDHLLARISSNPLISRPPDVAAPRERPRALLDYIASMRRTRELALSLVLGGHGDPIADHSALIDERLRMHERRARKIEGMLGDGPRSAWEIALGIWGNVAVTQAYLTVSEVLGHLDLLAEQGRVQEIGDGEGVRYYCPPAG